MQRSNGDVFFSNTICQNLKKAYPSCKLDLLVNDDTLQIASLIPFINKIHFFSYKQKEVNRFEQEKLLISKIFRAYDLSINLTASDRSVAYAIFASSYSISAIEETLSKSWWKKLLLSEYYKFDSQEHILLNNFKVLDKLGIKHNQELLEIPLEKKDFHNLFIKFPKLSRQKFIIFHPGAQYNYKVYTERNRNDLLSLLDELGIKIVITGSNSTIDQQISNSLPKLDNLINLIGKTTLKDFIVLSKLSEAYIGMDTLNMHIAASQNKRIFAIFGPTNIRMWSPWSNMAKNTALQDQALNSYGLNSVFQAELSCVACGKAGCNDNHFYSDCLDHIKPESIFVEVEKYLLTSKKKQ